MDDLTYTARDSFIFSPKGPKYITCNAKTDKAIFGFAERRAKDVPILIPA